MMQRCLLCRSKSWDFKIFRFHWKYYYMIMMAKQCSLKWSRDSRAGVSPAGGARHCDWARGGEQRRRRALLRSADEEGQRMMADSVSLFGGRAPAEVQQLAKHLRNLDRDTFSQMLSGQSHKHAATLVLNSGEVFPGSASSNSTSV